VIKSWQHAFLVDIRYYIQVLNDTNYNWYPSQAVIRIDDISIRTDVNRLSNFLDYLKSNHPNTKILLAVSVGVIDALEIIGSERVFPPILNAMSDHRNYFRLNSIGVPEWLPEIVSKFDCEVGSHGLVHVDHRLLDKEAQILSVMTSLSILKSHIFVPPFNKYNIETIELCRELGYKIVIWEDGWNHLSYQKFDGNNGKYYLHMHDFDDVELFAKFQ